MERKKPRPHRAFTPEFRLRCIELCRQGDRSIGQVAKDFPVQLEPAPPGGSAGASGATEIVDRFLETPFFLSSRRLAYVLTSATAHGTQFALMRHSKIPERQLGELVTERFLDHRHWNRSRTHGAVASWALRNTRLARSGRSSLSPLRSSTMLFWHRELETGSSRGQWKRLDVGRLIRVSTRDQECVAPVEY